MKTWRNKAAPDDPNAWADVSGMWPTPRGTYECSDVYDSGATKTATGETSADGGSAWALKGLTAARVYVLGAKIWEYSGGTLTDRTNAVSFDKQFMCQYGDVSVVAGGTTLAGSTGGNFSSIAGSPSGAKIVVSQSNALVVFNYTSNVDGWAASDVGDYTNWSTGEAASGRILEQNGPITAAVPFGNDIIVFKADSIFRMTYVGGLVKWQIQKIVSGVGCATGQSGTCLAESCGDSIVFVGRPSSNSTFAPDKVQIYRFDGSSAPVLINPDCDFDMLAPVIMYDPQHRRVQLVDYSAVNVIPHYYCLDTGAWGRGQNLFSSFSTVKPLPVRGDFSAAMSLNSNSFGTTARALWQAGTDSFKIYLPQSPGGTTALSAYVKTAKYGSPDRKTLFSRATPLLRRRTNNSGGSPACSLTADYFLERHDISAAVSRSVTESTTRKRFDLGDANCFGQFKVTFTDMDAEIDDLLLKTIPAGVE